MKKLCCWLALVVVLVVPAVYASTAAPLAAVVPTPVVDATPMDTASVEQITASAPMPSWFDAGQPTEDALAALDILGDAQSQGLNPEDYQITQLLRAVRQVAQHPSGSHTVAELDLQLTAALERYLSDLVLGRLSPAVLKHRFKAPDVGRFDARAYIAEARRAGRLHQALLDAQPRTPMYESIRAVMNAYRAMGAHPAWQVSLPPLPARFLKPGDTYEGLYLVVARLAALGDLPTTTVAGIQYEGELVDGVRRFQRRHGLEVDGVLGPATLAELNVAPAQRVEQMALTLERLRWTPLMHAPRMIVVNVPEFILRAYELKGDEVQLDLEMRVVVGRALDTRTPIFLEDMRFIEFSPYWNIPRSIARGETLPRLRRDPGYFSQQGFEFVTKEGKVVAALSGEAIDAVQRGEWRIRQRPGPRNALGAIKFIFPNDQNIYLHHTPAPELFARARRDFSHGCIRVEEPVQLAEFVLRNQPEWTRQRIVEAMNSGTSRTLRLDQPIPVLIAYSTVVVKDGGKVHFLPDIYEQDARLKQALRQARPAA